MPENFSVPNLHTYVGDDRSNPIFMHTGKTEALTGNGIKIRNTFFSSEGSTGLVKKLQENQSVVLHPALKQFGTSDSYKDTKKLLLRISFFCVIACRFLLRQP